MICLEQERLAAVVHEAAFAVRQAKNLEVLKRASECEHEAVEALNAHLRQHGCGGHPITRPTGQAQAAVR